MKAIAACAERIRAERRFVIKTSLNLTVIYIVTERSDKFVSTAPIRGVAPRAAQQGHVIVLVSMRDTEIQVYHV